MSGESGKSGAVVEILERMISAYNVADIIHSRPMTEPWADKILAVFTEEII